MTTNALELSRLGEEAIDERIRQELALTLHSHKQHVFNKIAKAALSSIPWVGGFLSTAANLRRIEARMQVNQLHRQWLEEHRVKMNRLGQTLLAIMQRLETFGEEANTRLESDIFLEVVRQGFRLWDQADNEEKRQLITRLLINAGVASVEAFERIRLYQDWIARYHAAHFGLIRVIHQRLGHTLEKPEKEPAAMQNGNLNAAVEWQALLLRDLEAGGVIRQQKTTEAHSASMTAEDFELTALGRQFVHLTMNELVPRVDA